jgi:hypothetical protein
MHSFISATIEKTAPTQNTSFRIKGIVAPVVPATVPYSGSFCLPRLAERNDDTEIKHDGEFKHPILAMYHVSQKHTEPPPCYHLEPADGHGYALYQRKGSYMYLVAVLPFIDPRKKNSPAIRQCYIVIE